MQEDGREGQVYEVGLACYQGHQMVAGGPPPPVTPGLDIVCLRRNVVLQRIGDRVLAQSGSWLVP